MRENDRRPVVLTVDDQDDHRRLIALMLTPDHEVIEAPTSHHALAIITSREVDFVLTDSNLPDYDGMQFCRDVRQEFLDKFAIIFVTASGEHPGVFEQMIDAGANAIVNKPFRRKDLLKALRETRPGLYLPPESLPRTKSAARTLRSIQEGIMSRTKDGITTRRKR